MFRSMKWWIWGMKKEEAKALEEGLYIPTYDTEPIATLRAQSEGAARREWARHRI